MSTPATEAPLQRAASDATSPWERALRFVLGRDVFLSYARKDAALYVLRLAAELEARGFSCALDQHAALRGRTVPADLMRDLDRCSSLVIVGSRAAAQSDNVRDEIERFSRRERPITVIAVDDALKASHKWSRLVEGLAPCAESEAGLNSGRPAHEVLDRIIASANYTQQRKRQARINVASLVTFVVLIAGGLSAVGVFSAEVKREQDKLAGLSAKVAAANQEATKAAQEATSAKKEADAEATRAEAETQNRAKAEQAATDAQRKAAEADLKSVAADAKRTKAEASAKQAVLTAAEAQSAAQAAETAKQTALQETENTKAVSASVGLSVRASMTLDEDPEVGLRLALDAVEQRDTPEAISALRRALQSYVPRKRYHIEGYAGDLYFSADDRSLVLRSGDGGADLIELDANPAPRPKPKPLAFPIGRLSDGRFILSDEHQLGYWNSRDGSWLAIEDRWAKAISSGRSSVGVVIETPAGNVTLWTAKGAVGRPWKPDDILNGAEPLPNGAGFVALGYKSVYVHQGATTRSVELDEHSIDSRNNRPFVSPRGDVLAFVDDVNDVEVWRIRDLKHMCTKHPAGVFSGAAFSGNGALFALSSSAGLELFRDGPCGRPDVVATRPLEGVAFPSHGRALLAWDRNEATVLDTAVPARRIALKRANGMEHVAFDSTGCRLAASSFGPDVDVWDLCSVQWRAPQQLRSSFLADGAFDQTGRIAYLTFEDEAVLWRSQRSEHQALWHSQKGGIWGVGSTFSSGGLFAFYDGARKVNVLDMTTMKPLASPELALIWPSSIALGGDGSWIAGLHRAPDSWHNEISVLDLASGARLNGIEASDAKIAAHPIEPWIGISDVQLRLWNWRDDRTVELAAQGTESGPLAFSRNGSALAATRADRVYVWHFADGPSAARGDDKPVATPLLRYVYSVQWSWDGRFIATSSAQGVDVWDAASALPVWHIAGNRPLAAAFVSPSEIVSVWSDKSDNILRQDTCDACRAPDALVALAHERLRGGAASSDHFSP